MSTLYIEPFAGMAGDMFLAALLDLDEPRFVLSDLQELAHVMVPGESRITLETAWRGNLSGKLLTVHTPETGTLPHRGFADLKAIVARSPLSEAARARAIAVLWRIAVAEANVHGTTPEEIHFHEIGAVDTLVDVCGAVYALDRLGVERVLSAPPVTGTGTVMCAHGEMPVPTPAVAELLRGKPMVIGGGNGERLTPTGAAVLAEIVERFGEPGSFEARSIGYGAGARDPKDGPPNILRVQLGALAARTAQREAWLVEVNLDDMSGEELAHAADGVRAAGALDVWTTSVLMKKGRPGVLLSGLCRASERAAIERALFELTTTLGVRWRAVERTECERRIVDVQLDGQTLRVKVRERPGARVTERDLSPEHDDVARVAAVLGTSLREVERRAIERALASMR
ncbi:MAG: nickel pincer cofactor biosynthesis protein LarC [Planctomycetota bacterium]